MKFNWANMTNNYHYLERVNIQQYVEGLELRPQRMEFDF
jgi:hypothetical protein